jgi:dephospho-CoA kinase
VNRLVVGLAGGVGSGKSTVAAFFRKWGARVIDADAVGHRVLERPDVRARLAVLWGPGVLRNGRVDRAALARAVFRSRADVERLNRLVHPVILREMRRRIREARGWVVLDAALLFEAGADSLCDRVVFVRAPRSLRARRTAARGWTKEELRRRERFQWPPSYKEKKAHYVIDNTGSKSRAKAQARTIYEELRAR